MVTVRQSRASPTRHYYGNLVKQGKICVHAAVALYAFQYVINFMHLKPRKFKEKYVCNLKTGRYVCKAPVQLHKLCWSVP